jgi:hypothetical protein
MCETPHERPSPSASLANLRQPGPLRWKVQRFLANNGFKILHRKACCGNRGEPGC